jgi:hypothetical protein
MGRFRVTTRLVACGFLASVTSISTAAFADSDDGDATTTEDEVAPATAKPKKDPSRSGVSPVLLAGNADGLAAGVQLDLAQFALRSSLGYFPLVVSVTDPITTDTPDPPRYEFFNTYQVNAEAILFFMTPSATSRLGADLGYRYNSELGHGVAFGGQGEFDLWASTSVLAMLTFSVFPNGTDRILKKLNETDKQLNFPFGAGFNGGLGLGLKF